MSKEEFTMCFTASENVKNYCNFSLLTFPHHIQTVTRNQKENPADGVHPDTSSSSASSSSAQILTHTHYLILDLSSVSFMDSVTITALCKVRKKN